MFSKSAFTDSGLSQNQDRITDKVWLTRADIGGLFNATSETAYIDDVSPVGTEWAEGTLDNYQDLQYTDWRTAVNSNLPASVNDTYVLHLIDENIYIEVTFLS